MRCVVLLLSERQKKSQPEDWLKSAVLFAFLAVTFPLRRCDTISTVTVVWRWQQGSFITSRGMNIRSYIHSIVYWKGEHGAEPAPSPGPLFRDISFGLRSTWADLPLPFPVNPWFWIARSRAPVHSSVSILPAGRPLTRSLLIRKLGAKNRYHFSKIDCELLGAATRSPDYRTITSV